MTDSVVTQHTVGLFWDLDLRREEGSIQEEPHTLNGLLKLQFDLGWVGRSWSNIGMNP